MKYRRMGKYGMRLSEVSLGAWLTYGGSVEEQNSIDIIHAAIENKVNFIDTADVYSGGQAEVVVGKALSEDQFARKDLVVSSKVFWPKSDNPNDSGLSRKHIMDSIQGTLQRLDMEYIDIYYCHRYDWQADLYETVGAMDDLIREDLIRYWGTSVWTAAQLERAVGVAKEIGAKLPAVEQPRYNLIDREIEREILYTAQLNGIGITPWSPLEQGILTGKYNDGIPAGSRGDEKDFLKERIEKNREKVIELTKVADELGIPMAQMALAWILRRDEITSVITGATKISQLESNVAAVDVTLSNDTLEQIEEIMGNKPEFPDPYKEALKDR